jgi:hypothetical protein
MVSSMSTIWWSCNISILTVFLSALVQACTVYIQACKSSKSWKAASETSYVRFSTSKILFCVTSITSPQAHKTTNKNKNIIIFGVYIILQTFKKYGNAANCYARTPHIAGNCYTAIALLWGYRVHLVVKRLDRRAKLWRGLWSWDYKGDQVWSDYGLTELLIYMRTCNMMSK